MNISPLMDSPSVFTVKSLAELLSVHEHSVRSWIKSGRLRAIRPGPGTIRIPASEVARLLGETDVGHDG